MDEWLEVFSFMSRRAIEMRMKLVCRAFRNYASAMRRSPYIWFTELTIGVRCDNIVLITLHDYTHIPLEHRLEFKQDEIKSATIPRYVKVNDVNLHLNVGAKEEEQPITRLSIIQNDVIPLLRRMKDMWNRNSTPDIRKSNRMHLMTNDEGVLIEAMQLISLYLVHIRVYGLQTWPLPDFLQYNNFRIVMQLTIESDICDFTSLNALKIAKWLSVYEDERAANYVRELRIILTNGQISSPYDSKYHEIYDRVLELFENAEKRAPFSASIHAPVYLTSTAWSISVDSQLLEYISINERTRERLYARIQPNEIRLIRNAMMS